VINWPDTLVREVAKRRCVLFLGAGVSASATGVGGIRPKEWQQFLIDACRLIAALDRRTIVGQLITERRYLLALQAIKDEVDAGDYQTLLNDNFNTPAFQPSKLHEIIFDLDSRLVITTNFDKIYERYCLNESTEGFKVIPYYSPSLADELRSDTRIIIKAHGSIDDVQRMFFTRAEYHSAKQNNSNFYEILKAIFLLNTVIFLGCGFEDPDVQLLLEEVKITSSGNRPHYILIKEGSQIDFGIRDWHKTYNVKALEYGPDHNDLITDLEGLLRRVDAMRATFGATTT
jgi:hypothetical protein